MIWRGRKFVASILGGGFLAGSLLFLTIAGLPSAALAAAGRVMIVSGGTPQERDPHPAPAPQTGPAAHHYYIARRQTEGPRGSGEHSALKTWPVHRVRSLPILNLSWAAGPDAPGPDANRDLTFIHDLIAKFVAEGIAAPGKVFLVGTTTGGMLALRLACEQKSSFSGLAILAASLPADLQETCKLPRPLPLLMIAGTQDPVVPFHGGPANLPHAKVELASIDTTLALFGKAAGCSGGITTTVFPDRDTRDGTRAYLDKLNNCKAPVELVRIEGGGHSLPGLSNEPIPGAGQGLGNGDVNSAKLVWDFFRPLGG